MRDEDFMAAFAALGCVVLTALIIIIAWRV